MTEKKKEELEEKKEKEKGKERGGKQSIELTALDADAMMGYL